MPSLYNQKAKRSLKASGYWRTLLKVAFSSTKGVDIDPDLLSAISAVLLQTGIEAVQKLTFEPLFELIVRGEKGIIVVTDAGPLVLIGAGVKIESLGHVVSVFRHFGREIAGLFAKK